jgi:hypothetical protein
MKGVKKLKEFNKESVYETQINATAKALAALCYKNGIPMFFSAAVANTDDGSRTEYRTEFVSAAKVGVDLTDDQLSRHVNVKNGFNTVMPKELDEIEV